MQGAGLVNIDGHLVGVIATFQPSVLVNGDIIQGGIENLFGPTVRNSHIVNRVDILLVNFFAFAVRHRHPDISGLIRHTAIDGGTGAGEGVGILGRAVGGICLQAGAVAVAQVVHVHGIRAVGAIVRIAHITGFLIAGQADAFRGEYCVFGLGCHQLVALRAEVLLVVDGGGGDDLDFACRRLRVLNFFVSAVCHGSIDQFFDSIQPLFQGVCNRSVFIQHSRAIAATLYSGDLERITAAGIVGEQLLRADRDRQTIVHNNHIIRRLNAGIGQSCVQIVGAGNGNGVRRGIGANCSQLHAGEFTRVLNSYTAGNIGGIAVFRRGIGVHVQSIFYNIQLCAFCFRRNFAKEFRGLAVFQREMAVCVGGSSGLLLHPVFRVGEIVGLVGNRIAVPIQSEAKVNAVDIGLLRFGQRRSNAARRLGLGNILCNGKAVPLGQVELDQAVGTALATIHIVDGQVVVALGCKTSASSAEGFIQVGLTQGFSQICIFGHIFIGRLVANFIVGRGQGNIAGGEVDFAVDGVMRAANVQRQHSININPNIIVAGELKDDVLAFGILAGVGHLEGDIRDQAEAIGRVASIGAGICIVRIHLPSAFDRFGGCFVTGKAAKGLEASHIIGSNSVVIVGGGLIRNQHGAVGSTRAVCKIHGIVITAQGIIAGLRVIDEGNLNVGVNAGIVSVAPIRGKQVRSVHLIAERNVAALAELAGGQAGVDVVVLRVNSIIILL